MERKTLGLGAATNLASKESLLCDKNRIEITFIPSGKRISFKFFR